MSCKLDCTCPVATPGDSCMSGNLMNYLTDKEVCRCMLLLCHCLFSIPRLASYLLSSNFITSPTFFAGQHNRITCLLIINVLNSYLAQKFAVSVLFFKKYLYAQKSYFFQTIVVHLMKDIASTRKPCPTVSGLHQNKGNQSSVSRSERWWPRKKESRK